jgi:hypothetical protein
VGREDIGEELGGRGRGEGYWFGWNANYANFKSIIPAN